VTDHNAETVDTSQESGSIMRLNWRLSMHESGFHLNNDNLLQITIDSECFLSYHQSHLSHLHLSEFV